MAALGVVFAHRDVTRSSATYGLSRRRHVQLLAGITGAAMSACVPASTTTENRSAQGLARPATVQLLVRFAPISIEGKALASLLARVRKVAPKLTINVSHSTGDPWQAIVTALAAGTPPDASVAVVANAASLGALNVAEPLQILLKKAKGWSADDYFPGAREAFTYRGDFVAAPYYTAPMAVAINQDLLNRAGLKVPDATWTWRDLTQYAVTLTRREGDDVKVYGAQTPTANGFGSMNFFGGPLWSHGGDWADRMSGTVSFHKPEGIAALDTWVNLALRQRAAPTAQPESWKGLQGGPFVNGLAAMAFIASPQLTSFVTDIKGFPWTVVPMPRQSKPGSHFYSGAWFVTRAAKEKDGAAEFVRLASAPDEVAQWNIEQGGMVTRSAAAAQRTWQDHLRSEPRFGVFNEAARYARSYPAIPGWTEASNGPDGIGQALLDAVTGKVASRTVLEEAARRATAVIAQQSG